MRSIAREPRGHVRDFLAERRRAGRLAVRAREHRLRGVRVRERDEAPVHRAQRGQDHVLARAGEHHAVRRVVDVFRRACEVDEFARLLELDLALDGFLQPVFDGFHVVVRHALDFLDARGVVRGEALDELQQELLGGFREARHFGEAGARQRDQPVHLDGDAVAHEGGFGEPVAQRLGLAGVAAVERRERGEGEKGIGTGVGHDRAGGSRPRFKREGENREFYHRRAAARPPRAVAGKSQSPTRAAPPIGIPAPADGSAAASSGAAQRSHCARSIASATSAQVASAPNVAKPS